MSVALWPSGFVTTTLAAPVVRCAVIAVIEVALTTLTLDGVTPPIVSVAPVTKFVPVMVTLVPPMLAPMAGVMFVTVGAGRGV